jgi:hypothetical protein
VDRLGDNSVAEVRAVVEAVGRSAVEAAGKNAVEAVGRSAAVAVLVVVAAVVAAEIVTIVAAAVADAVEMTLQMKVAAIGRPLQNSFLILLLNAALPLGSCIFVSTSLRNQYPLD